MKIALIGRTKWLLDSGKKIISEGGKIELIVTSEAEKFYKCNEEEFREFAKLHDIKFCLISSYNQDHLLDNLRTKYDIALSINWPYVLNSKIRNRFKLGVVNFHCGDLPKYRGNACPNWAIINGEKKIGLTAHFMDDYLDSGPILLKKYLKINAKTYIKDVYDWLDREMPNLASEIVTGLKNNKVLAKPQSKNFKDIIHCFPRKPIDSKIDWYKTTDSILALIRASSHPFDGAFTFLENGTKVVIWKAVVYKMYYEINAIPGQFLFNEKDHLVIASIDGAILLKDVKVVNATDMRNKWDNIRKKLRNRFI